jgi:hypothetical protein
MPRLAAADANFSPFCGSGAAGRATAGKALKSCFKMAHWPQWAKNNLQGVLGISRGKERIYFCNVFIHNKKKLTRFQYVGHLHLAF